MSLPLSLTYALLSLLLSRIPHVRADAKLDQQRIGSEYTTMPLYRSGAGTNVLNVNVGSPPTEMRLTCSTNVDFFIIAATGCEECVEDSNLFEVSRSDSLSITEQDLAYVFPYPSGSSSTISIAGRFASDIISDERGDEATPRPIVLGAAVQTNDPSAVLDGVDAPLTDGTGGFWGTGVYQERKSSSMIPSMIIADNDGPTEQLTSFTVGFQINNFSTNTDDLAGKIHWGAVPAGTYEGNFNWLDANPSLGGSWAFDVDRFRIGGEVIGLENHYGTVDPGFDSIYVPTNIAERVFAKVNGAVRDGRDTTRWNVPCDASIDLKITISGTQYAIDPTSLVRNRDVAGRTCWSSIVAWQNGSVPEARGEVRLGTPFMSGVYTALYYSESAQYVGLAGKPGSVNAANLYQRDEGEANKKLAGILIGTLVGLLIFVLILCYARNRSSVQSIWYRALRRQQRAQMNAVVRGATLPPPIIPVVGMGPPIIPRGPPPMMMGMTGAPMMPPTMGMTRPTMPFQQPPPPYQPPIIPQQQVEQHQPLMPSTVQPRQEGYYSPRLQNTSPPKSGFLALPFKRSRSTRHGEYEPPYSGGSKVHFGPTSARQMRSTSLANSLNEFGQYQYGGPEGRYERTDGFIREYNNLQPSHHAHQQHQYPSQEYHQQQHPAMPALQAVPEGEYRPPQQEKKRYFSWRMGAPSEQGHYAPVVNPQGQAPSEVGSEKRKSWWGKDRNGGWYDTPGLDTPRMKRGLGWS
ncbi:hypothetical protein I302_104525 [Kwoniella bestiolae CBS 10118]|uniref:Peptidase A1 domain-containing protein n=1 Tax=Kwoniella bestiolae CBS 10118 TaxID=1296100 RepID=A0A1B9GBH3_9TREE|nr:hypothetical protein I302_03231 [Kwoniella bestiolae CBS 10118]OCF28372.1 hypothetical protein I302_03231 [Kwoniella bestiolae CBS 10118]